MRSRVSSLSECQSDVYLDRALRPPAPYSQVVECILGAIHREEQWAWTGGGFIVYTGTSTSVDHSSSRRTSQPPAPIGATERSPEAAEECRPTGSAATTPLPSSQWRPTSWPARTTAQRRGPACASPGRTYAQRRPERCSLSRQHGAGERCSRLKCRSSSSGRCASTRSEYAVARSCCSAPWCSAATRSEWGTFPVPDYGALSTTPTERSWRVSAHERSRSRRGQSAAHADEPR